MIEKSKIVEFVAKQPGFSTTMAKIIELANDAKSHPDDFIQAISLDPILTAKILKLINSAYFGMPSEVLSIQRAVIMLGLNTIKNIALSSAISSALRIHNPNAPFTNEEFWEHNLACAVGSKLLAQSLGEDEKNWEEFFICGLLHDIGMVVFVELNPDEYKRIFQEMRNTPDLDLLEEEKKVFGFTHPEVGVIIAEKWKLPQILIQSVRDHHQPDFERTDHLSMRLSVYISNIYCNHKKIGIKLEGYIIHVDPKVWDHFPLKEQEVQSVMEKLPELVEQAKVFLHT